MKTFLIISLFLFNVFAGDYELGLKTYENYDFALAYKFFTKAANNGNANAQLQMALHY